MVSSNGIDTSPWSWRALSRSKVVIISGLGILLLLGFFAGTTYKSQSHSHPQIMSIPPPTPLIDLPNPSRPKHLRVENIPGYFVGSDIHTNPADYDYRKGFGIQSVLGLINRPYDTDSPNVFRQAQWLRFETWLNHTNANAPENVVYKVIYMGRHGEGEHNVAEEKYGTPMWDEYYSRLANFTDPKLTPKGYEQAQDAGMFFESVIKNSKLSLPQSYYVSPLQRCLSTAMLTFSRLELPKERRFHAVIKERLRETLGVHTCDKRQSRTWIFNHFNAFDFEPGFTEEDELWDADHRETNDEHVARAKLLLTDIFNHDNSSIISFTAHSGMISALLQAVGHRPFPLPTGSIIAVLLKGEWNDLAMSWGTKPTFASPPELRAKAEADQEQGEDAMKVGELIDLAESI